MPESQPYILPYYTLWRRGGEGVLDSLDQYSSTVSFKQLGKRMLSNANPPLCGRDRVVWSQQRGMIGKHHEALAVVRVCLEQLISGSVVRCSWDGMSSVLSNIFLTMVVAVQCIRGGAGALNTLCAGKDTWGQQKMWGRFGVRVGLPNKRSH